MRLLKIGCITVVTVAVLVGVLAVAATILDPDTDGDGTRDSSDCAPEDPDRRYSLAVDGDCDGVHDAKECFPADPERSTLQRKDSDCDGIENEDDCDPADLTVAISKLDDRDCDGAPNAMDCDANDPAKRSLKSEDSDCDGQVDSDDCKPEDPVATLARSYDADCDGVPDNADCGPNDASNSVLRDDDSDCDGLLNRWDCKPDDPAVVISKNDDMDCDGVPNTQEIPSVDALWYLDRKYRDCDGDMAAEPPGDDQFDRRESELKRAGLKTEEQQKRYLLLGSSEYVRGSDFIVTLGKYDFNRNRQAFILDVDGVSFGGSSRAYKCSGDRVSYPYCLGYCIAGDGDCTSEYDCTWNENAHALKLSIELPTSVARTLDDTRIDARITVRVTGILRVQKCVVASYDCDDLQPSSYKSDAGPATLVRVARVGIEFSKDGEVFYQDPKSQAAE